MEYAEFKVGDLFKVSRGKRLISSKRVVGSLPFVTAGMENTGISDHIGNNVEIFPRFSITIDMFGYTVARNYDFGADDHITILQLKKYNSMERALYLSTIIQKNIHGFSYSKNFYSRDAISLIIYLPIKQTTSTPTIEDIDWDYIDSYMKGIYTKALAKIEDSNRLYEQTMGKIIEPVVEEFGGLNKVLSILREAEVEYKEFKVGDLFEVKKAPSIDAGKVVFKADGKYDFIGRTSTNYGIQGKIDKLSFEPAPKNTLSIVQVGQPRAFYREDAYYSSQNIFMALPKFKLTKQTSFYVVSVLNRQLSVYSGYSSYPTLKSIVDLPLLLPVKVDSIDFQYMEAKMLQVATKVLEDARLNNHLYEKEVGKIIGELSNSNSTIPMHNFIYICMELLEYGQRLKMKEELYKIAQ